MDTKTLNDELRMRSSVEKLRAHVSASLILTHVFPFSIIGRICLLLQIRKKMAALSYGCVDMKDFYRRLFASFDNGTHTFYLMGCWKKYMHALLTWLMCE